MLRSIAIITARGGSKRIPRKNIRNFCGAPIIKYSIDAALESNCFDEVMVSTDDFEIASIAKSFGARVPFLRSSENSNDHATTAAVIAEVLQEYTKQGVQFQIGCCLYPTAPFITAEKLILARKLLLELNASSVVPVTRFSFPIQRSFSVKEGLLRMNWPENKNVRSQDLPPSYHDAGQFYFFSVERFLESNSLFTDRTAPLVLSELEVQDIDNEDDWRIAELKYELSRHRDGLTNQNRSQIQTDFIT